MYELSIMILFSVYVFLRGIGDGIHVISITLFTIINLILFIGININQRNNHGDRFYRAYQIGLIMIGFMMHPLFMVFTMINESIIKDANKKYVGGLWVMSLLGYTLFHQKIEMEVFIIFVIALVLIFNFIDMRNKVNQLESEVGIFRDTTKVYKQNLNELSLYSEQIQYHTRIAERNEVAQILHDKLGHTLAGNIMRLEVVKILIPQNQEKSLEQMNEIITSLREGMDEIRVILKTLKPARSEIGIHSIKECLDALQYQTHFKVALKYEGNISGIQFTKWKVIKDNLIEATTNLKKHSNGDFFEVGIYQYNEVLKVEFKDNGYIEKPINKQLGLRGMEERVIESGGKIRYNIEKGFQITIVWVEKNDQDNHCG